MRHQLKMHDRQHLHANLIIFSDVMDAKSYHGRETSSTHEATAPLLAAAYLVDENPVASPPPICTTGTTGTMGTWIAQLGPRTVIKVPFVSGKIEEGLPSFSKSGLVGTNVDRREYYAMCKAVYPTMGYNQTMGYNTNAATSAATGSTATGDGDWIAATGDGQTDFGDGDGDGDEDGMVDTPAKCGCCVIIFILTIIVLLISSGTYDNGNADDRRLNTDGDAANNSSNYYGYVGFLPVFGALVAQQRANAAKAKRVEIVHAIERKTARMDGQEWEIHEQVEGGCCGESEGAYANVTCNKVTSF